MDARGKVIGWAIDSIQDTHLVERALRKAYMLRGYVPDGDDFPRRPGTTHQCM